MKTRHAVLMCIAFLLPFRPGMAAGRSPDPNRQPAMTAVPEAGLRLFKLVNRERNAAGLVPLSLAADATGIAAGWTRQMASAGEISHNQEYLSADSVRHLNATLVGENVAVADAVDQIHDLFMHSPHHRANILEPEFRLVGFGAVRAAGGQLYITEDFLTRQSGPASRRTTARRHHGSDRAPVSRSGTPRRLPHPHRRP